MFADGYASVITQIQVFYLTWAIMTDIITLIVYQEYIMKIVLILISAPVFMIAAVAHIIIKLRLNTKNNPDIDDYYYEFEEQEPNLAA